MDRGERPELRPTLEAEKKQLFDKAIQELAESVSGAGHALPDEQLRAVGDRILDSRWATAMRDYKSLVASLSIPPAPPYPHDSVEHAAHVDAILEGNAERTQRTWEAMRELFKSGKVMGRQTHGDAYMSDATAKELVIFLAKSQNYR